MRQKHNSTIAQQQSDLNQRKIALTFLSIILFYFFEFAQMSYFNVLAPSFLATGLYNQHQIGSLSAAYYYGNVVGLLPAGYLLDHFCLRKVMLLAILGSILGALLLVSAHHFSIAWTARFCCGLFGGTFSFIGGIRILADIAKQRFAFFMGIFLTAGMLGGSVCQYPLLWISNHIGVHYSMLTVFWVGFIIWCFNIIFLHPERHSIPKSNNSNTWRTWLTILKNFRNWGDCLLIIFIDSPFTILGTLWGIVTLTSLYHFSSGISALIISLLFFGSMLGSSLFGAWSQRVRNQNGLVFIAATLMCGLGSALVFLPHPTVWMIALLFFGIGFLTGSQTIVFSWLITTMQPHLIGRNSAVNSMLFMGAGGCLKQICASLLVMPALIFGKAAALNLLLFISLMMLVAAMYVLFRSKLLHSRSL